ncbi:unnamed protein product [Paramecium sonneborni]|uniref:Uncharacterized protein n=1 Tax=Paramecium sonneborni TaxID=65129 RepID=A0A8S1NCN5_9CILI|nr:unnamed protein product [Paramecium sonneborni]
MNQRQLTLQTFLQKQPTINLEYQLPTVVTTNSVPISQLWSEKYCQKVLRVSNLKTFQQSQEKQKRITAHIKVQKFFQKPKFEKVNQKYQAAEIYGFNQIIEELDKERSDIKDLSQRITRSVSREEKEVKFKKNREQRKQDEFIEFLHKKFTPKPLIRLRNKKHNIDITI